MTTYNTGNALGSSDARDLYDNAENIDNFANGTSNTYQDRLGVTRKSLAGINAAFDDFIESSGYTVPVAYASGIVLSAYNQLIEYNDEFYKLKAGQAPYTTTGTWGTDSAKLVAVGDAALRQELTANANDFNLLPEVENYAALDAYTGDLTAVYVRGVADIFDGGHGVFRVDAADTTTADNGGTVIVDANGRRWKREFSGAINVRWFGATGDGIENDLPAFNAAAIVAAVRGSLYIPQGTYSLGGRWQVNASNLTIYGDGEASCIINTDTSVNSVSTVHVIGNNNIVRDIRIDGIKSTITGTLTKRTGLIMAGDYPTAENVTVHDTLTAGMSIGFGRGVRVSGCVARDIGYFGGDQDALGIVVSTATQASIVNCVARNTARTGIFAYESTRVTMSGNTVDGCENGLRLDAVDKDQDSFSVITGNVATNGTGDGIRFTGSRVTVSGNLCFANGGSGAASSGGVNQTISGNTFVNNGQNGIRVGQEYGPTLDLTIVGNGCFNNITGNGIFFANSSQAVTALVVGNNLIGNDKPLRLTANSAASTLHMADNNWSPAVPPILQVSGWTVSRPGPSHGATTAASTITLYGDGYHGISGTADITNITALPAGNAVILYFVGTAASSGLIDGTGNLRLAGNFAYTPNSTIHLVSNGVNWLEVSRSIN